MTARKRAARLLRRAAARLDDQHTPPPRRPALTVVPGGPWGGYTGSTPAEQMRPPVRSPSSFPHPSRIPRCTPSSLSGCRGDSLHVPSCRYAAGHGASEGDASL